MIINLDAKNYGGLGDIIFQSWVAGGVRATGGECSFFTKNTEKRMLLSMLSQPLSEVSEGAIDCTKPYDLECREHGKKMRHQYMLDHIGRAGVCLVKPLVRIPEEDMCWAREFIDKHKRKGTVLLFPQTCWATRLWPTTYWIDLAWELWNRGILAPLMVNNSPETYRRSPMYCNRLPLERVAALMKLSDAVVGNDSFPIHLSSTIGTRTIGLFGPTKPEVVMGYNPDPCLRVIQSDLRCTGCHWQSPIFRGSCDIQCQSLMALTPERVMQVLDELGCSGKLPSGSNSILDWVYPAKSVDLPDKTESWQSSTHRLSSTSFTQPEPISWLARLRSMKSVTGKLNFWTSRKSTD